MIAVDRNFSAGLVSESVEAYLYPSSPSLDLGHPSAGNIRSEGGTTMKTRTAFFAALLAGLICAPISVSAQGAAAQANAPRPDKTGAVTLNVVVTDKSGAPVADLQPADFKLLLDKKQPHPITSVKGFTGIGNSATSPDQLILVLDAVNALIMPVNFEIKSLTSFFQENGGQLTLPTTLFIFTEDTRDARKTYISKTTRDGKELAEFLKTTIPGLRTNVQEPGGWGAMDRETASLKLLDNMTRWAGNEPGKKLMIWLSPGWSVAESGNMQNVNKQDLQNIFNSVVWRLTKLREGNISLYIIPPEQAVRELDSENYIKGADQPGKVDYGHLLLPVLAQQSGGQVVWDTNGEVAPSINKFIQDAKAYYQLTFTPSPAAHPNEFHSIQVEVDKPGLKARTNTIFYAQPTIVAAK
jgi:VWFA-related protein